MIPAAFLDRMRALLGDEFAAFREALSAPDTHALRAVEKKLPKERLLSLLPFKPTPLAFFDGGFLIPAGERPGAHPLHHAGAYYMQDPSAMATVSALPFTIGGWRVLDLCAAPGGKTGRLSEEIGGGGLLVSNEIVPSRARILLGNVERLGVENTVVTSAAPQQLATALPAFFDLVVVDAPCSGEGMFRKYPEAAVEWSPEAVTAAAERSRLILDDAAKTVSPGGYLLYSTCTFSEEENEETVAHFLSAHPDFRLVPVSSKVAAITADGIVRPGRPADLALSRRYYPHKALGEGQYIALLERTDGARPRVVAAKPTRLDRRAEGEVRAALGDLLGTSFDAPLAVAGDTWIAPPCDLPSIPGILRAGVALGTFAGRVFVPHHHAYTALGDHFARRLELSLDDPRVTAYLRGEEIPVDVTVRGFAALTIEGAPTGGVKLSGGVAKNHYPKGLRDAR